MRATAETTDFYEEIDGRAAHDEARVTTEIEIDAPAEEVWEALATEEGRERWLEEPGREIEVVSAEQPHRLVWWWADPGEPATRVEFELLPAAVGTRVIVVESAPQFSAPLRFPSAMFRDSLLLVAA